MHLAHPKSQVPVYSPFLSSLPCPETIRTLERRRQIWIAANVGRDLGILAQRPRLDRFIQITGHSRSLKDLGCFALLDPICGSRASASATAAYLGEDVKCRLTN